MSNVEDILAYSWNKDAVSLKPALDAVMTARAEQQIELMSADVAASMFGSTTGNQYDLAPQDQYETEDFEDYTTEETPDEE